MSEMINTVKRKHLDALMKDSSATIFQIINHGEVCKYPLITQQDRRKIEQDPNYLQLIPYVVILDKKIQDNGDTWVISYKRRGSEARLYDNYSIGFGGHWRSDEQIYDCIHRELKEELSCLYQNNDLVIDNVALPTLSLPIDLIYVQEDNFGEISVNNVHLGLIFTLFTDTAKLLKNLQRVQNNEVTNLERILLSSVNRNVSYEQWSIATAKKLFSRIPNLTSILKLFTQI